MTTLLSIRPEHIVSLYLVISRQFFVSNPYSSPYKLLLYLTNTLLGSPLTFCPQLSWIYTNDNPPMMRVAAQVLPVGNEWQTAGTESGFDAEDGVTR